MKRLIGLSVSFCIQDICEGRIPLEEVAFIIPRFQLEGPEHLQKVWERYCQVYWKKFPEKARQVLDQVEIRNHPSPKNISAGTWMLASDYHEDLDLFYSEDLKHRTEDIPTLLGLTP